MAVKGPKRLDDGNLQFRCNVTMAQGEADRPAILRGIVELFEACDDPMHAYRIRINFERDTPGRETSRRIFLTLIAEPRQ